MRLSERIKTAIKQRNTFSLSKEGVLTGDWGDIIPLAIIETVPTDNFTVQGQVFMRLKELASPTFGRIHGFINHFYVPSRILMPEYAFEDSITGGSDGDAPERFPFITYYAIYRIYEDIEQLFGEGHSKRMLKLFSYLGLGTLIKTIVNDADIADYDDVEHSISLLPFLALFRIYGDYYFPYGLEDDANVREALHKKWSGLVTSGNQDLINLEICFSFLSACYAKDYFTSAFTRPQRGAASLVPVKVPSDVNPIGFPDAASDTVYYDGPTSGEGYNAVYTSEPIGANNFIGQFEAHAMRWAQSIQAFLERNNIAGGRYFEQMLARFGVKLKAEELNRSRYLGGNDFWVNVSDVTKTTSSSDIGNVQTGLGAQAGKGIALGKDTVSYTCDEYGFFVTLFHFMPETGYVDGLERMWTRHDKYDYWQPELEDTGMQPIYNKELYAVSTTNQGDNPDGVFGYVPRYSEYKFSNPVLGGDYILGSGIYSQQLMDSYHLFRRVSGNPVLNTEFVRLTPMQDFQGSAAYNNFDRVFQNTNQNFDHFDINVQMSIGASRPMLGFAESGMEFANDQGGANVNVPYGGMRL